MPRRTATPEREPLTQRECDVLALVAAGHTDSEIGEQLDIGKQSVSDAMSRIQDKLGARSRPQAVAIAVVRGQLVLVPKEVP